MKKVLMLATVAFTVLVADDEVLTPEDGDLLIDDALCDANLDDYEIKSAQFSEPQEVLDEEIEEAQMSIEYELARPLMSWNARDAVENFHKSDDEDDNEDA